MSITAGLAQSAAQAALYAVLTGDASLMALVSGVYDAVPDSALSNYLAFGEWTETSDDTLEDNNAGVGADLSVTLHAYTDDSRAGAGYKRAQAILSRVKVLLHGQPLTIAGWATVTCEHEDTLMLRDEDEAGKAKRHGISTYTLLVEAL